MARTAREELQDYINQPDEEDTSTPQRMSAAEAKTVLASAANEQPIADTAEPTRTEQVLNAALDSAPVQAVANVASATSERASRANDWLSARPTPGGIALIVAFLLLMVWVIVPVTAQGMTRSMLLWHLLLGRVSLKGRTNIQDAIQLPQWSGGGNTGGGGGGGGGSGFGGDEDDDPYTDDADDADQIIFNDDDVPTDYNAPATLINNDGYAEYYDPEELEPTIDWDAEV